MIVLGLETSCDETGLALYDSELGLRGQVLYSQIKLHAEYGGVVPELASRDHVRKLIPLINQLLEESNVKKSEIDDPNHLFLLNRSWMNLILYIFEITK